MELGLVGGGGGGGLVACERGRVAFRVERRDDRKYVCVCRLEN